MDSQLKSLIGILVGSMVVGLVAVVVANAHSGPPAVGVIHSCVNNNSGVIKIVEEDATCKHDESALDWNAESSDGENGISGYERIEVDSEISDVNPMTAKGLQINCPAGKKVLGGGSQA